MPELPEVETVRRGLAPALVNHALVRVETRRGDLRVPFPPRFSERLTGRRVLGLARRAKYLLAELDKGETLVMHLGMSGRFTLHSPRHAEKHVRVRHRTPEDGSGRGPHDHVVMETEQGTRIVYTDHRRFGLMTLIATDELPRHPLFKGLGPEPLDPKFTPKSLSAALKDKRTPIKAALVDQGIVSGIGNIYACEALFRAGISPRRRAAAVAGPRTARLVRAIKEVLREAIKAGGSTLRDYAHADGELGEFQHAFQVYQRGGEPCPRKGCKGTIKRLVQTGRSTWYCPSCQR